MTIKTTRERSYFQKGAPNLLPLSQMHTTSMKVGFYQSKSKIKHSHWFKAKNEVKEFYTRACVHSRK